MSPAAHLLLASLTEMAADLEDTCRSSYGRSHETALDDWREQDPQAHALWLRARAAMAAAADELAADASAPTGDPQ